MTFIAPDKRVIKMFFISPQRLMFVGLRGVSNEYQQHVLIEKLEKYQYLHLKRMKTSRKLAAVFHWRYNFCDFLSAF